MGWNFTCKHPLNYLLPHRPAIREERDKAKIRAVFDASCSTSGPSLNECLYSGEWRVGTYGVEWHCFPIWWFKKVSQIFKTNKKKYFKSYDSLGFIAPVTARVKVIFQLLCKDKVDRDDCVTDELKSVSNDFMSFIWNLNCIKIQRFVFVAITEKIKSAQSHVCYSPTEVYCAVN